MEHTMKNFIDYSHQAVQVEGASRYGGSKEHVSHVGPWEKFPRRDTTNSPKNAVEVTTVSLKKDRYHGLS